MKELTDGYQLHSVVPILEVGDLSAAVAFYEDVLGFLPAWTWDDPKLASVCQNEVQIILAQTPPDQALRSRLYIEMSEIDSYCARLERSGAEITVPLADRPCGMRDFRTVDPFGNDLSFGQAIEG